MAKVKTEQETAGLTGLPFTKENYILMGAALAAIIFGYILLGSGSITMAPILLVLGYCVLFPVGIIWGGRKRKDVTEQE
jgi:hypothetical protein